MSKKKLIKTCSVSKLVHKRIETLYKMKNYEDGYY